MISFEIFTQMYNKCKDSPEPLDYLIHFCSELEVKEELGYFDYFLWPRDKTFEFDNIIHNSTNALNVSCDYVKWVFEVVLDGENVSLLQKHTLLSTLLNSIKSDESDLIIRLLKGESIFRRSSTLNKIIEF